MYFIMQLLGYTLFVLSLATQCISQAVIEETQEITISDPAVKAALAKCSQAKNCQDCMGRAAECVWCFDPAFPDTNYGPGYRCAPPSVLKARGCPEAKWENILSSVAQAWDRSGSIADDGGLPQQLNPARQRADLRPNVATPIEMSFTSVRDYPVDLYYLTDLSYTMRDDLETVSKQAQVISQTMKQMTKRFRIGFGAFVDKPVAPFVNPQDSSMRNPCEATQGGRCDPTFLFKHLLSLTSNITKFQIQTNSCQPSGNLDKPEGGLDALLQVAQCGGEIGWQGGARKIVLFTTDGSFHLAGDGRLAGLVEPAPSTCQLSYKQDKWRPDLWYTGWHDAIYTDYPSVGQLARVLAEKDMNIIFATSPEYVPLYEQLAVMLPSAAVGVLQGDSSNIVELLRENYEKIVSSVTLDVTNSNPELEVTLMSKCEGETEFTAKKQCKNHPLGGIIQYKLMVKPKTCFVGTKLVELQMFGLKDSAKSIVEVQASCECSKCLKDSSTPSASKCNSKGNLVCGVCQCDTGFSGDFCECGTADSASVFETRNKCIQPGTNVLCSGRGRCICGKCKPNNNRYTGTYLECDLEGCKRASDDNKVCGGPQRGRCLCNGTCECKPGYTHSGCDCMRNEDKCRDPKKPGGPPCSNHGKCDCGVCFCSNGWTGLLCSEIEGGQGPLCTDKAVKKCILCVHSKKGKDPSEPNEMSPRESASSSVLEDNCLEECNGTAIEPGRVGLVPTYSTQDGSNLCVIYDAMQCRVYFTYRYSDDVYENRKVLVQIQTKSECPTKINLWIIIGGVVGAIVGIGILLLLIWKLVVTIDDRRELAKFEKEADNARWEMEENPIFKAPVTTVTNPMYSGID